MSGVGDHSLCHGSAGIAHLFNRIFQQTGDTLFLEASLRWYSYLLGLSAESRFKDKATETTHTALDKSAPFIPELLEGDIGVMLSLLSAMTSAPPGWDRVLLASA